MMGSGMNMGGNMNTDGSMTGVPTINNQTFDMNRIDETVATSATEIWEFDGSQSTNHTRCAFTLFSFKY